MKLTNAISPVLKYSAAAALLTLGFTGCMTSPSSSSNTAGYTSSGESAFIKQESENMGQVWNSGASASTSTGLAKEASDTVMDTITGDLVITPLHYDSACQCFVRVANYTSSVGFERQRLDSITLVDSNGNPMSRFRPLLAKTIIHNRHVTRIRSNLGTEVDVNFNTTLTWADSGSKRVGVWNGTITGTFNGVTFKTGSIDNVVRTWYPLLLRFGFPSSGSIDIDRISGKGAEFTLDIVFTGEGSADVSVTNKATDKTLTIHIGLNNVETSG